MYELFYTWLLPTSLAGTLAALLGAGLIPLARALPWRWRRKAVSGLAAFFLIPVGPVLALLWGAGASVGLEPVSRALEQAAQTAEDTVRISAGTVMTAPLAQPLEPVEPDLLDQLLAILPFLWAVGAALFTLWQMADYLRFCKALRRQREPLSETEGEILQRLRRKSGQITPLRAFVCPGMGTPLLTGVVRPVLYLPKGMDADALELALLHELAHLNGGDLWCKAAMRMACRVHWFNPACHWQAARLDRLCELACDETAVKGMDRARRKAYGRVLLAAAAGPLPAGASGMNAGMKHLKTRLCALFESPRAGARQVLAAGAGLLAVVCLTACAAAGASVGVPQQELLPENGPATMGFLEQHSRQTVPQPMPEPTEKPALSAGQASVKWVREEQSLSGTYEYMQDEALALGEYVVDRDPADGLEEVSGWAFYDEQGLLNEYREVDRITLQAPVQGIVRYNGELEAVRCAVEQSGESTEQIGDDQAALTLVWPVAGHSYVSRWMDEAHKGTDIVAPKGNAVYAMAGGEVTQAGEHYSYGNYVVIDHGGENRSLYAHLDTLNVGVGTQVQQGETIGTVGCTGNVTGNACHVELYVNGERQSLREWFPDEN